MFFCFVFLSNASNFLLIHFTVKFFHLFSFIIFNFILFFLLFNISFLLLGYDKELNHPVELTAEENEKYGSDLLMIGRTYRNSWGYKRALFYSKFSDMYIKIYGRGWELWFDYFPELKKRYYPLNKPLTFEMVNLISNCCKIYPIDANPVSYTHLTLPTIYSV